MIFKKHNYREKYLSIAGIEPDSNIEVHHLDKDRDNNNVFNLVAIPKKLHKKLHGFRNESKLLRDFDFTAKLCEVEDYLADRLRKVSFIVDKPPIRECQNELAVFTYLHKKYQAVNKKVLKMRDKQHAFIAGKIKTVEVYEKDDVITQTLEKKKDTGGSSYVPTECITDLRISGGAFRVLSYMFSKPKGWDFCNKDFQDNIGIGRRETMARYWKELIESGWVFRTPKKGGGFNYSLLVHGDDRKNEVLERSDSNEIYMDNCSMIFDRKAKMEEIERLKKELDELEKSRCS